ncbi:hypothetical protein [Halanaerobium sp. ST460_2HS_T2]|uniref:hypothetical protein n=1 Tax=Halanaerobium sp. ST460_2HS_T2 TaxID=2183914 RepID=UPI000DF27F1A|nr:hypothetical protein [Halanaerobium sp. ST460_2HS_T2]RCW60361.1 hypothetical protein DFR80_107100 [Halanaerobium sp. ST460_2HS_T2]
MKKYLSLIILITLVTLCAFSTAAAELPFSLSGDFKTKYIYDLENENNLDQTELNLEIEKDFSYTGGFYLNLGLESYSEYLMNNKNRETELSIKEGYFDYYTENIDWRAGKQIFNWGSSYNIKPSNYFNPIDIGAINPLENREGINALQAKYYLNNVQHFTAVVGLREDINDFQQALKFTKRRWHGFDFSLSLFRGNELEKYNQNEYPKVTKAGFDITGDIGQKNIGIFSEVVYNDFKSPIFNDGLETVVGFDYKFGNNLYLLGQYYYQKRLFENIDDSQIISLHAEKPFWQFHSWEANLLYDLNSELIVLRPKIIYSLTEAMEIEAGAVLKANDDQRSQLARANEELIYLGINSYF